MTRYGAPRPRYTAAQRAGARAELARMREAASWAYGNGRMTADAYAAELARIDAEAAKARARGLL
jgi:hypothetical protein